MGYWGVNFWSRDFLGSLEALGIFWGFDFCPHLIIPVTGNPEYPPGKQVFQAVPCSWFLGEAEMTSYQDEHAPIKFMTGVPVRNFWTRQRRNPAWLWQEYRSWSQTSARHEPDKKMSCSVLESRASVWLVPCRSLAGRDTNTSVTRAENIMHGLAAWHEPENEPDKPAWLTALLYNRSEKT